MQPLPDSIPPDAPASPLDRPFTPMRYDTRAYRALLKGMRASGFLAVWPVLLASLDRSAGAPPTRSLWSIGFMYWRQGDKTIRNERETIRRVLCDNNWAHCWSDVVAAFGMQSFYNRDENDYVRTPATREEAWRAMRTYLTYDMRLNHKTLDTNK